MNGQFYAQGKKSREKRIKGFFTLALPLLECNYLCTKRKVIGNKTKSIHYAMWLDLFFLLFFFGLPSESMWTEVVVGEYRANGFPVRQFNIETAPVCVTNAHFGLTHVMQFHVLNILFSLQKKFRASFHCFIVEEVFNWISFEMMEKQLEKKVLAENQFKLKAFHFYQHGHFLVLVWSLGLCKNRNGFDSNHTSKAQKLAKVWNRHELQSVLAGLSWFEQWFQ